MNSQSELIDLAHKARLHNIIDMGLTFSGMIRLFKKGSKKKLQRQILIQAGNVFKAKSQKQFLTIHSNFCDWGTKEIALAERKRRGRIIKESSPASYGQIAKTFDITMKVAVYYSHLPNYEKSQELSKWLNAGVDTKMMAMLKKRYPKAIEPWPTTIEQVDKSTYVTIQGVVHKFIKEEHNNAILPVQFDDIYWKELNR